MTGDIRQLTEKYMYINKNLTDKNNFLRILRLFAAKKGD